ncbi:sensor histidine kinase [Bradyrhizobium sp. C-145]|uniref:sensor histidine kinase n=1 Tax=Bradyrhizobium sp. C-145 TaxID=574727 RepID=UPI00201B8D09|nr:sensor histidine kinase [Bradyrhizobium sp. C-145]UQR61178.1 sensor histidine kinase [Bradyrhizobium sp. C-145]
MAEAAASVQHREILLRELQHRVKNNFQIILSSIGIQKRRFDDPAIHRALDHVANRINAIALAHDQLAIRQNVYVVNVASYLRALVISIEQQVDRIVIDFEADETELSIERAVPLGLILNEVVTNSIKHAFDEAGGRISITLQTGVGFGEGRLTISDNGGGIKKPNTDGSGLKLIDSLARQIGGEVHRESSPMGTSTSILFPLIS